MIKDIQTLEESLANSQNPLAKIEAMNALAYELQFNDLSRALSLVHEAEQLVIEHNLIKEVGYADTLCLLGYFNLRKGDLDTAVDKLFIALKLFRDHNHPEGQAKANGIIGLIFSQIGNFTEALSYQLEQLRLSEEYNLQHEQSLAFNGLGIIQNNTGNHQEALISYKKSIAIAEKNNDIRQKAISLSNCAYAAFYLDQFTEGIAYGEESILLSQQVGNKISESHARLEIAKILLKQNAYTDALRHLQINLELLSDSEYSYPLADTLITIGNLYNQWQKPEFAHPYLDRALNLSQQISSIIIRYRCHNALSQTYQQKGDFEKALQHYTDFHILKEQVTKQQANANLKAIELSHQIETVTQERLLLQEKNRELELAIAERQRAENEIKSYQESLEDLVEKRTQKLQRKNEELERFTYTVSHDLKSPLITIRGFLGLLKRDIADNNQEKIERNINRIDSAADRMLNLLENLLELSRIGHTTDTLVRVPLLAIILEAKDLVTGHIKEKNVTIKVENDLPVIYGDYQRLVELFQNLIDNGCKFMGEQPNPQITIGASEKTGGILCFVQDNGIGIEPKYHSKVFNLFERLDQSTNGTGVGLALVKRIVEYHNGRIWIQSEGKNQGTTFFFTLQTPTFSEFEEKV